MPNKNKDYEIEINLIIDDCPEHYAYCENIDDAIKTLIYLKDNYKEDKNEE